MGSASEVPDSPAVQPASPLRTWERILTWIIFAFGAFGLFGLPYAAGTTWSVLWDLTRSGAVPVAGYVIPFVFFVGALLLLLRRKAATFWLAAHIPMAIAYLSWQYSLGWISA